MLFGIGYNPYKQTGRIQNSTGFEPSNTVNVKCTWYMYGVKAQSLCPIITMYLSSGISCSLSFFGHGSLKLYWKSSIFTEIRRQNIIMQFVLTNVSSFHYV